MHEYTIRNQFSKPVYIFRINFDSSADIYKIWRFRNNISFIFAGIELLNQNDSKINMEDITKQCKEIPNWKAPGLNGIQGY